MVEEIIDALTYKIRFDSKKTLIKMRLEGIQGMSMSPLLMEYQKMKAQIRLYIDRNFRKRTVQVTLNDYLKEANCFLGTIKHCDKSKKDFQKCLLEESYVYCDNNNFVSPEYREIQEARRKAGLGLWSEKLVPFRPKRMIHEEPQEFMGRFSWVVDAETVFVQPQSRWEKLEEIAAVLNDSSAKLDPLKKEHLQIGVVCAAPYQGELYRARITSCTSFL